MASLVFFSSIASGLVHAAIDPSIFKVVLSELQSLVEALMGLDDWELAVIIFLNNSIKVLAAMVLGIVFGVFPIFFLFVNGYLIGIIAQYYGPVIFLAGIVPHGIFEISALLLGAGAGISLGWTALKKRSELKTELNQSLIMFLKIVVPLLLVASLIETFITPMILDTAARYW